MEITRLRSTGLRSWRSIQSRASRNYSQHCREGRPSQSLSFTCVPPDSPRRRVTALCHDQHTQGALRVQEVTFWRRICTLDFPKDNGEFTPRNSSRLCVSRRYTGDRSQRSRAPGQSGKSPRTAAVSWNETEATEVCIPAAVSIVSGARHQFRGAPHVLTQGEGNR